MAKIVLSVEEVAVPFRFEASTNDADTARLVACYGERYGLTDTQEILSKWFENIVLSSKADAEEHERNKAIEQAKNSVTEINVVFN